jgi:hypothetical protein
MKPLAFICDIDGTIAYHDGIRGHYEYEKVSLDLPIKPVIEVIKHLSSQWNPLFLSGRMEFSRMDTVHWIDKHVDPLGKMPGWPLYMREDKNYEPDFQLKERIYRTMIYPFYNVQFAIDDRLQVCQMWHRIGISVFRVGDPDATF